MLTSVIPRWIISLANYRSWRVIEISRAVSVTKFIKDEKVRTEVEDLTAASKGGPNTKPLIGRCVSGFNGSLKWLWRTDSQFLNASDG